MRLFLFFVVLALGVWSCSTQKQVGETSKLKKFYHNTTSLYNGYFNANVLMEESIEQLEAQVTDNYNKPLAVYKYVAAENPQALFDNLDRAIEKVSVVVHLHRGSDWTDDSYLLMAQAQFLKQDYEAAQETLEYFLQEFDETGQSKSLKKKVRKAPGKSDTKARKAKAKSAKKAAKEKEKSKDQARKEREKERKKEIKTKEKGGGKGKKKVDARQARAIREARREQAARDSAAAVAAVRQKELEEEQKQLAAFQEEERATSNAYSHASDGKQYNPDKYIMKHKPCYQEAVLWLAKTYVMRSNYDNARMYLKQLENSPKTFKEIRAHVAATEALSYIRQKNYASAISPMAKAAELATNRAEKARFSFILAQLLELNGNHAEAVDVFERVVKMRPNFEMEFHANMGVIRNKQLGGTAEPNAVASEVKRMLRERKFEEFKGELYLTMALIKLNQGDREESIKNLDLALQEGRGNTATNAEIYYLMGNLHFDREKYVDAKSAYDGALSSMHKKDERFPIVQKRANSLTDIAKNLSIIMDKDSMLRIANMSDDEKMALAKEIKKKKEQDLLAENTGKTEKKNNTPLTFAATGNRPLFFAYDQKNISKNKKEFDKVWKGAVLEDNWRRSSKSSGSFAENEEEDAVIKPGGSGGKISAKEMEDLLAGVPRNPAEIAAAEQQIMKALYELGGLFNDKLDRVDLSVQYLEKLLERFPDNPHLAEVYYRLYVNHKTLGNKTKSDYYKHLILEKYSESLFAEVIRDPDYFRKKREEENKLNVYYASTYEFFSNGNYEKAFDMSSQASQVFGNENKLRSKFALLRAMCIGKLQGADEYSMALRELIARYPDSEEQVRAREILRLLGQRIGGGPAEEKKPAQAVNLYSATDNEMHYVIVVLQSKELTLNDAKVRLSNYNNKYHRLEQLKISNIVLGEKNNIPVVVLRRFDNKAAAMKYFEGTQKNKRDFLTDPSQFEMFAISQTNYRQLITSRAIEPYREFFMKTYL